MQVFVVLVTVSCFKFRHDHENIVDAIWVVATLIVLGLVIHLFLGTHHKTEAVVAGSLSFCFAIISAGCVSYLLYWLFFHSYFAITDLKAFGNVEVIASSYLTTDLTTATTRMVSLFPGEAENPLISSKRGAEAGSQSISSFLGS